MKRKKRSRSNARMEPIDTVLHRLFTQGKFGKSVQVAELENCWAEIVGADAARHCVPEKIGDGKLYIKVDSPVWHQQIDMLKEELLEE